MAPERAQVTVPLGKIMFPSLCSKCLIKNDLINYISEWKTTYIREWPTKITRKASVYIPICRSCKKELIRNERIFAAKAFVICAPLTWGTALVSWLVPSVGNYILSSVQSLGILGSIIAIIGFIFALIAIVMPFIIIWPHTTIHWPVKFEKHHVYDVQVKKRTFWKDSEWTEMHGGATFSLENETYATLFATANRVPPPELNVDRINRYIDNLSRRLNWEERQKAASALGKIKDPKAVEPLIEALKDEDWHVREKAADVLGNIGEARALEALAKAKEDETRLVRWAAGTALKKIKKNV